MGDGIVHELPAGPFAFTTLQLVSDEEGERYELTGTDGTMEVFDPSTGCLLSVTDHDGNQTTYNWSDGQLQTIVDPAGHTTTFSPNDNGTVNTITDFAGRDTTLAYVTSGAFPVLTSVTLPDPEYTGETQPVSNFAYDPVTLLMTTYVDANNNATQFGYRSNGTLATMTGADGSTVSYQSALPEMPPDLGQGQPLPGSEANSAPLAAATVRGVVSDQLDRTTLYTFDQFGNYTSVENALAQTTVFQRDDNGQVTEMDQPEVANGTSTVTPTTTFNYDTVTGLPTSETNPDGSTEEWTYVTTAISTPGGPYWFMTSDSVGVMSGDTFVPSRETVYTPDEDTGDVLSVDQEATPGTADGAGDSIVNYTYTTAASPGGDCPAGLIVTAQDPGRQCDNECLQHVRGRDAGLVSEVELPSDPDDANPILVVPDTSVYFGYDSTTADLTSVSNPVAPDTTLSSANTTYYAFDGLDREVNETDPADSDGHQPQTDLLYDAMGNVTSQQVLQSVSNSDEVWQNTTYSYNTLEQLSTISAPGPDGSSTPAITTYTYTLTGLPYQITDATGGVETFGYDAIGEQTSDSLPDPATGAAGGPTTYYSYNALGEETSAVDPSGNETELARPNMAIHSAPLPIPA